MLLGIFLTVDLDEGSQIFLRFWVMPMIFAALVSGPIALVFGLFRWGTSPYGVTSGGDLIEVWHLSRSFYEAADSCASDHSFQFVVGLEESDHQP